jgi:hypothetical protein
MLRKRGWFPPKLGSKKAVVEGDVVDALKRCKVIADRSCVDQHLFTDSGTTLVHARPKMLLDFIRNDLVSMLYNVISLLLTVRAKKLSVFPLTSLYILV